MDYLTREYVEVALGPPEADLLLLNWSAALIVDSIMAALLKAPI